MINSRKFRQDDWIGVGWGISYLDCNKHAWSLHNSFENYAPQRADFDNLLPYLDNMGGQTHVKATQWGVYPSWWTSHPKYDRRNIYTVRLDMVNKAPWSKFDYRVVKVPVRSIHFSAIGKAAFVYDDHRIFLIDGLLVNGNLVLIHKPLLKEKAEPI